MSPRISALLCLGLAVAAPASAAAQAPASAAAQAPTGVVLTLHGEPPAPSAEAPPTRICGARWTEVALPPAPSAAASPEAALAAVEEAYVEADHLECLARVVVAALHLDRLLTAGLRETAARRETLEAACAHGAGDDARAQLVIDRLLTRELFTAEAMADTTPEFQALVEERRAALEPPTPVTIEWTVDADVTVAIDGTPRCEALPCHVELRPGSHVLTARALGFEPEVQTPDIRGTASLAIALSPASPAALLEQLADHVARGGAMETPRELAWVARAFDARFVIVRVDATGVDDVRYDAVLYDADAERVLARARSGDASDGDLGHACAAPDASEPVELWVGLGVGAAVLLGVLIGLAAWGASQPTVVWEIEF